VVELMVASPAAMTTNSMEAPAPTSESAMGMRAACSEPRTTSSTTRATATPAKSSADISGMLTANRSPPTWTSLPGIAASRSSPAAMSAERCSSVMVETMRPPTRTETMAAAPSSLATPLPNAS